MTATNLHDEFAVNTGGATGDLLMVRLDANGDPFKEPFTFEEYDVIDKGMVTFEITGFQTRFEMNRPQRFMVPDKKTGQMPSPTQPKTRLEFTILDGPQAGKRWLDLYTWAVGETATLGMLIRNLTRQPVPRNWRMTDVIGLRGCGYVKHSVDQDGQVKKDRDGNPYASISVDTVEPLPATPTATPAPAPKAVAEPGDPRHDPRISWTAFWTFAKRYGFENQEQIANALKQDIDALGVADLYKLLAAHVGHED